MKRSLKTSILAVKSTRGNSTEFYYGIEWLAFVTTSLSKDLI